MLPLNRIQLNGLRAIEVAGRLGTLSKAADELGRSVGAVSQLIIRAEQRLGHAVFERTPRGLVPTPFGRRLLGFLEPAFRDIARALELASVEDARILRVTTTPVFASRWLVPQLADFNARHPEFGVSIGSDLSLIDLDRSDWDVAIRMGQGEWPDSTGELLLRQRIFPVCAPALAKRLRTPEDLQSVPIIRYRALEGWDDWLAPHGLSEKDLPHGLTLTESSLSLDAAIAGLGVMIGWQVSTAAALRDGRLVKPFDQEVETGIGLWFVTTPDSVRSEKIVVFKRWLKEKLLHMADEMDSLNS